jgi:hypothetical protein
MLFHAWLFTSFLVIFHNLLHLVIMSSRLFWSVIVYQSFLFFITLRVLRSTGEECYLMLLKLGLSKIFIIIRLELWVF